MQNQWHRKTILVFLILFLLIHYNKAYCAITEQLIFTEKII